MADLADTLICGPHWGGLRAAGTTLARSLSRDPVGRQIISVTALPTYGAGVRAMREFITGNEAIVRGAIRAGCNYFAGYPITPASSILTEFIRSFEQTGGVAIETEDEMAAIGQCIGASMAGAKVLTATSGPGLSLYSENIGLAQMGEVPLVIVDCQRMGPATGGATSTSDGDVMFARHVTSGSYPIPVLAATDAASAYRLTYEAFNIAERLRTPVIVLASKELSLTRQTVDLSGVDLSPRIERTPAAGEDVFKPYAVEREADVPLFAPIGGRHRVRFTGSIHNEHGLLTIEPVEIGRKLTHLTAKFTETEQTLEFVREDPDPQAKKLIISYGVADGAVRQAVRMLRAQGEQVSHLTIHSLWPLPSRAIQRALTAGVRYILVPELNIGLYWEAVQRIVRDVPVVSMTRYDGRLLHPSEIVERVLKLPREPVAGVHPS